MSSSQKALLLERTGGTFVEGTRPIPKPGAGELLVKIKAFALNPIDWKLQDIAFPFMEGAKFPAVLGSDIAGDVEEVGEGVQGWNEGERMYGVILSFVCLDHVLITRLSYPVSSRDIYQAMIILHSSSTRSFLPSSSSGYVSDS